MKQSTMPEGPPAFPLLGHIPYFLADRLGFLLRCAQEYGDVVPLEIGEQTYLLNDAEDIRHVLTVNPGNYEKTSRLTGKRGRRLSGEGLLTAAGACHRRQRRMMQPLFHHKSIAVFAEEMVRNTNQMLEGWQDDTTVNIADEMMTLAQGIVLRSLFSKDVERNFEEISKAMRVRRAYISYVFRSFFPFPEYFPARITRKYRHAIKLIDDFIYGAIRSRRNADNLPKDLLSMLMQASYRDGGQMDDQQVRDEVLTISVTGYETIGEALTWTWYLLSQHPEVESKLWAELDSILGRRLPTVADVPKLTYTEMVLSESMRLYPPTWIFIRMVRATDTLPSGATISAGSKIYLCPYVVHRNPRYFPQPESFNPERFSPGGCDSRPKFAHFPFGGGPRLCIGESFARMESVLALARIAQRFQLTRTSQQMIVPEPGITLHPKHGMWMRLHKR